MKKNILNAFLLTAISFAFVACKNNTTTTTTTTETVKPVKVLSPQELQTQYLDSLAQQLCSCEGASEFFVTMKEQEAIKDAGKTPSTKYVKELFKKLTVLTVKYSECLKPITAEITKKYPETEKNGSFDMAIVKVCGDKLSKKTIAAIQKRYDEQQKIVKDSSKTK
jgi:hypothetical protein